MLIVHPKFVRAMPAALLVASVISVVALAQSQHSDHGAPQEESWKTAIAETKKNETSAREQAIRNSRSALFDDKTGHRKPLDSNEPKDVTTGWSNNPPYWVRIPP